jgi:proline iminopeptidase
MTQERVVEVRGARLWSVRTGAGLPVAMLHGGPGMWDYLGPVAATVEDIASVVRYDQRGCGRSTGDGPFDVETAVADLDALRAAWSVERWVVFGHSWGASLALAYAVEHPEQTLGLVYVSGTGVHPTWHAEYRANRATRLAELGTDEKLAADVADPLRLSALRAWLYADGFPVNSAANRALGADADRTIETSAFAARLRELHLPTLVIHGELDPRPARFARQMAELIPGAELLLMPKVGHFPRFEAPEPFTAALRGFLSGISSPPARGQA